MKIEKQFFNIEEFIFIEKKVKIEEIIQAGIETKNSTLKSIR